MSKACLANRRQFLQGCWATLLVILARTSPPGLSAAESAAAADLGELLAPILQRFEIPGMAAAVVQGSKIAAVGVAGVRQVGKDDKISPEDRFLIGSCTKRMTGLMICRLIDAGKLAFETALGDVLSDIPMREVYRRVTIAQLLSFTGGIPAYTQITPRLAPIFFQLKGTLSEQRSQFARHLLQEEPVVPPGTQRVYSNASYFLLATVASHLLKQDWETIMRREVFEPLKMASGGFGRPRDEEHPNEPVFHLKTETGYVAEPKQRPIQPERILAGAGGVHCSIRDFAKFAAYELAAAKGNDPLLTAATAKRWQELSQQERAAGRPIFGGTQWMTAGYVLWPEADCAAAVAINGGGAMEACRAVFAAVQARFAGPASNSIR